MPTFIDLSLFAFKLRCNVSHRSGAKDLVTVAIGVGLVLQAQVSWLWGRYATRRPNDVVQQLIRDSRVARWSGSHDCE